MSSPTITVTFTLKDVQDFFAAVPAQHRMAALDILMKPETQRIFDDALLAAMKRAEELAQG